MAEDFRSGPGGSGSPVKIFLVSDAWLPQVNGVVTTLRTVVQTLESSGNQVYVIHPDQFSTVPCPTYPEIRLAYNPGKKIAALFDFFGPQAVHIATEGPLGLSARNYCLKHKIPFTTSFHTRFAEYVEVRTHIPAVFTYRLLRWFHSPAARTMVAAPSFKKDLETRGFKNTVQWSRGVDTELFRPGDKSFLGLPRPIFLCVGRVAPEKNIEAFLELKLPGTKLVVGDGPQLAELKEAYPDVRFAGPKFGEELARYFAASDVFVFPSRTDTFGLVVLEALASGVPVAAYPVPGPMDVLGNSEAGCLDEDLGRAALRSLSIDPAKCRELALKYSWRECARQFFDHLERIH